MRHYLVKFEEIKRGKHDKSFQREVVIMTDNALNAKSVFEKNFGKMGKKVNVISVDLCDSKRQVIKQDSKQEPIQQIFTDATPEPVEVGA